MNTDKDQDKLAFKKIAGQPEGIQWLLEFSQLELKETSKGRMEDLCREIRIFSQYGWIDKQTKESIQNDSTDLFPPGLYLSDLYDLLIKDLSSVSKLQILVKSWITQILKGESIHYQEVSIQVSVAPIKNKNWTLKIKGPKSKNLSHLYDAFIFNSLNLLANYGSKIKKCIKCEKIYLAWKYTQNYCSTRCLQAHHRKLQKKKTKT